MIWKTKVSSWIYKTPELEGKTGNEISVLVLKGLPLLEQELRQMRLDENLKKHETRVRRISVDAYEAAIDMRSRYVNYFGYKRLSLTYVVSRAAILALKGGDKNEGNKNRS